MKNLIRSAAIFCSLGLVATGCGHKSDTPKVIDKQLEAEQVRQKAKSYVDAFNRKDAKAITKLWADNALIHPDTGETLQDPVAIESYFQNFLNQLGDAKLELHIKSIEFPKENEAVEEGTSILTRTGEDPITATYRAYYEKRKGEWRLVEVEEPIDDNDDDEEEAFHARKLQPLEWLIGTWVDTDRDYEIRTHGKWDEHKKFILQHFSVAKGDSPVMEGHQVIGWDPVRKTIRSWIFDSAGGYGEGRWTKKGDSWIVEASFTLANGDKASSVNTYSAIGPNTYTWQSSNREVAGRSQPDIPRVQVLRR